MHDAIGDNGAETSGFELSSLLEVFRTLAARPGKCEVSARGHAPRRLKHRFNSGHETGLCRRKRIGFVSRLSQHGQQQSGLLGSGRHALTVNRVEPAKRIADRQHAAGQSRQTFEMPPKSSRKAVVSDAFQRRRMTERTTYCGRDQPRERGEETVPGIRRRISTTVDERDDPTPAFQRHKHSAEADGWWMWLR